MSMLVVGLSHKSAPVATLERAVVSGDELVKLRNDVFGSEHVAGTFIISTCNRVEIYAEVDKFHGGVSAICELLARHSGVPLDDLTPHLYVHYEDRAVQHLLAVACGLDSMVLGESQILGQVRQALGLAREQGMLGRTLGDLGGLALRAGKRAHAETGVDRAGASLVSVGITLAVARLTGQDPQAVSLAADAPPEGGQQQAGGLLRGRRVLVVGAGSMSALAAATARRMGAADLVVANRTQDHAERLAATVSGASTPLSELPAAIDAADLVISCTGATGVVITEAMVAPTAARRNAAGGLPLVLLDLAMPHDVAPAVAELPGASVVGLDTIGAATGPSGGVLVSTHEQDVAAVRAIVAEEFAARASAVRAASVTPTVVALRAKAAQVVDAELARLTGRLSDLDERARGEIAQTVRRVVDKLLHAPTVRVKELASSPGGDGYAAALRVLFDLDPKAIEAVTRAAVELGREESE
ncbi:MAG TPA: glutamyl-tRNA reductase [Streptosporangiaceae bacterium]|jgi:glutamyl-tRNA reductase